ncbi:hypothetical protein MAUB_47330 [Mycolicibacterium aubagnense]|uniref:PE-PGRS family protein n=1 Tax=Mycolicibacterium aubagnense TaxID=319707 RepID=A0ABM7IJ88_9MYCO|nr:hypothetical protein MAUB_47330 [Mycolicibacterium aubagnense]
MALVASAAAVSASFVAVSPQAKTMAAQLPEITRQVKLTAGSDPISLIEGLLALPTSVAQELLGNGQWINNLAYLVAQPLAAADGVLYGLDTAAAPVVMNAVTTLLSPIATTPLAPAVEAALQEYFKNAAFPPTGFAGSGLTGLNFLDIALASLVDFSAPATALFPAAVTLLEKLGIPLPLPGNLVPNAATNAALSPAITPAAATPQDLIGGLGGILTSALSTVWNAGAYLASIPINIGAQTAITLLYYGAAAVFHPDLLFSLLTSYIPNYVSQYVQGGISGFISTTTQFLSSLAGALGGLLPAAAAPLAATNVSKLQTKSAVTPSISPSVPAPQDLVGGLGNVASSAVSMVANDVAYAVNLPLAVAAPVVVPLVAGLPYTLTPQALLGLLTTNLPNALRFGLTNTVNEIVSQAGQFVSSLGGLVPAAAAPLAATSVPKVQTNLIKVSNPTAASVPNSAVGSKPDNAGTDKAGTDKTGSDKGGKHRKSTDSSQTDSGTSGGSSLSGAGAGKAGGGESKSGNGSHDNDGSKHSSDKSESSSHGTGDGHGGTGSGGGGGGHRSGK